MSGSECVGRPVLEAWCPVASATDCHYFECVLYMVYLRL